MAKKLKVFSFEMKKTFATIFNFLDSIFKIEKEKEQTFEQTNTRENISNGTGHKI